MKSYTEFLKSKMAISRNTGFEVNADELTPGLYPHVKDTVRMQFWKQSTSFKLGRCRRVL